MSSSSHGISAPLIVAIIIGLVLRVSFILFTPIASQSIPGKLSSYNDEIAHGKYAEFVLNNQALPKAIDPITADSALIRGQFENYQPPLYYLAVAFLAFIFNLRDLNEIVMIGRWINLVFFCLITYFALKIFKEISFSGESVFAGICFLLLNGVFVRFTSTASNDPLLWLFIGAEIWILLRMWNGVTNPKLIVVAVFLLVAGLYTKLTAILFFPLPLLVMAIKKDWKFLKAMCFALLGGLILTIPLWLRNLNVFSSFLPLSSGFGQAAWRIPDISDLLYFYRSLIFPWSEFWSGWYGLLFISIPIAFMLFYLFKTKVWTVSFRLFPLFYCIFVVTAAFIWLNFRYDQAEARYLFTAWPILMILSSPLLISKPSQWFYVVSLLCPYILMVQMQSK